MPRLASLISRQLTVLAGAPKEWKYLYTIDNPNSFGTTFSDNFGEKVAVSGEYAIVSAIEEDNGSGVVYIFNIKTGSLLHTITNPTPDAGDDFGGSIDIDGNNLIISTLYDDYGGQTSQGTVRKYNAATGQLVTTRLNPDDDNDGGGFDNFGQHVAIEGDTVVVAATGENNSNGIYRGAVYILNTTDLSVRHVIDNPGTYFANYDRFGNGGVDISGNYAIVGHPSSDTDATNSGRAFIYDVTTGALLQTLSNPNAYGTPDQDRFGSAVAIDGNYAVVAAYEEAEAAGIASGKVYVFDVTTGTLLYTLDNPNAYNAVTGDRFGNGGVDTDGKYIFVGTPYEDDPSGASAGKVYVFNVTSGELVTTLDNPNTYGTPAEDNFGYSVAVRDGYALLGSPFEDELNGYNSGKVHVFKLS